MPLNGAEDTGTFKSSIDLKWKIQSDSNETMPMCFACPCALHHIMFTLIRNNPTNMNY